MVDGGRTASSNENRRPCRPLAPQPYKSDQAHPARSFVRSHPSPTTLGSRNKLEFTVLSPSPTRSNALSTTGVPDRRVAFARTRAPISLRLPTIAMSSHLVQLSTTLHQLSHPVHPLLPTIPILLPLHAARVSIAWSQARQRAQPAAQRTGSSKAQAGGKAQGGLQGLVGYLVLACTCSQLTFDSLHPRPRAGGRAS